MRVGNQAHEILPKQVRLVLFPEDVVEVFLILLVRSVELRNVGLDRGGGAGTSLSERWRTPEVLNIAADMLRQQLVAQDDARSHAPAESFQMNVPTRANVPNDASQEMRAPLSLDNWDNTRERLPTRARGRDQRSCDARPRKQLSL